MLNICNELKCPHSLTSGCDRFSVSDHCPLARYPGVSDNQYWLFSDVDEVNMEELAAKLQTELLNGDSSKRKLEKELDAIMKLQLIAGNGLGMLNPINLREQGWESDMWLKVIEIKSEGNQLRVTLPSGTSLWLGKRDIKNAIIELI